MHGLFWIEPLLRVSIKLHLWTASVPNRCSTEHKIYKTIQYYLYSASEVCLKLATVGNWDYLTWFNLFILLLRDQPTKRQKKNSSNFHSNVKCITLINSVVEIVCVSLFLCLLLSRKAFTPYCYLSVIVWMLLQWVAEAIEYHSCFYSTCYCSMGHRNPVELTLNNPVICAQF